jgi:orotidine-5'-phosphate decarboxylase
MVIEQELNQVKNPILVALDVPSVEQAWELVDSLTGYVGGFKIGLELFTTAGPELVKAIRKRGSFVFLDLKFHDIPNTVAKAVRSVTKLDVQMITVHTCGGSQMLRAAEEAAQATANELGISPPLILGVTVLTSMNGADLLEVGLDDNVGAQVERLAQLASTSGIRGLVCSPLEITHLRHILPESIQLITPGIRPVQSTSIAGDDQKRALTPKQAIEAGADWLVIGRPIYAAPNPVEAAQQILEGLR